MMILQLQKEAIQQQQLGLVTPKNIYNTAVKLIERDPKRARRASELLENAIVLQGDAQDEELLVEENIDSTDVFAALTNSEEANILSAMLATLLPPKKCRAPAWSRSGPTCLRPTSGRPRGVRRS